MLGTHLSTGTRFKAGWVAINAVAVKPQMLVKVIAPVPLGLEADHSESLCKGPTGLSHISVLQTLDVIFYGDSITESWRGLQAGVPSEKFKGIPQVFEKMYGSVQAAAYSISGDTQIRPFRSVPECKEHFLESMEGSFAEASGVFTFLANTT